MRLDFQLKEFIIQGATVPVSVADKIIRYHILPMQQVRQKLGVPITASQKSGYRPRGYEIARGRSGNSQHTYGERPDGTFDPNALGAVDWTCSDLDALQKALVDLTNYTRIARYETFIHADYKPTPDGKRHLYKSDSQSRWQLISTF